ncbi:MAG: DUF89 family protein [Deltaproteobacteria bacterium]|nr:DUF89 family protein [Deltaproteobacteria bacterium]
MISSPYERNLLPEPFPGCLSCLEGLLEKAAELGGAGDPVLRERAQQAGRRALEQGRVSSLSSPVVANRILWAIRRETGMHDPYRQFKDQEMAIGQKAAARLRPLLDGDISSAVEMAALGNGFDFFKPPDQAMADLESGPAGGVAFHVNHIPRLSQFLTERPALVLYLTDNAGEIFFDLPLYRYLGRLAQRVVLVVKGGPALNDLTLADLEASGLAREFAQVADTGMEGVGVEWEQSSPAFKDMVMQAELMVAKGMANFETLCALALPCPIFHIFRVKCSPIQDYLHAPPNTYWALWRQAGAICRREDPGL